MLLHDGDQQLYQLHRPRQTWQGGAARLSPDPEAGGGKGVRTRPESPMLLGLTHGPLDGGVGEWEHD